MNPRKQDTSSNSMVVRLKRTPNFILTTQRKYAAVCVTLRPHIEQMPALQRTEGKGCLGGTSRDHTKDFKRENDMMRFDLKIKQWTQTTTLSTSTQGTIGRMLSQPSRLKRRKAVTLFHEKEDPQLIWILEIKLIGLWACLDVQGKRERGGESYGRKSWHF